MRMATRTMFLVTLASLLPRKAAPFQVVVGRRLSATSLPASIPPQKTGTFLRRRGPGAVLLYSSSRTSADITSPQRRGAASALFPTVLLRRTAQSKSFRNGNQLVFSKAIDRIQHSPTVSSKDLSLGDVVHVAVVDKDSSVGIGWGVYNPHSLYQVRILVHKCLQPTLYQSIFRSEDSSLTTTADDDATDATTADHQRSVMRRLLQHHIQAAYALRSHALQLPTPGTTDTYRLLNGEGDHLSGLAVDIIGLHTAVVVSSAGWCERYRDVIERVLMDTMGNLERIIWKTTPTRLQQDGYYDTTASTRREPDAEDDTLVLSLENGIVYQTYPGLHGQKTGVYCDQRDNRKLLQRYCQGKTVLDLCCYTGGFSLHAAVGGGATQCIGVDSSGPAIAMAQANARRNGVEDICSFVQADIATYLRGNEGQGRPQFDVVVLDPPKLAPNSKLLDKAARKYRSLNRDAILAVDDTKGGILLTCTCSAAMTQEEGGRYFLRTVQGAALAAGKHVTLLSVHGAAACHTASPVAFPAGAYLTAAVFYVHAKEGSNKGTATTTATP